MCCSEIYFFILCSQNVHLSSHTLCHLTSNTFIQLCVWFNFTEISWPFATKLGRFLLLSHFTLPCADWVCIGWLPSVEITLNLLSFTNYLSWLLGHGTLSSASHQLPFSMTTFCLVTSALWSLLIIKIILFSDVISSRNFWLPTLLVCGAAVSIYCSHSWKTCLFSV